MRENQQEKHINKYKTMLYESKLQKYMLHHPVLLWEELSSEHEQTTFCKLSDFPIVNKTCQQAGGTVPENL